MSGGVDSSTSAWLLKRGGHDVVAVTLLVCESCQDEKIKQAASVAEQLGIDHYVVDVRDRFSELIERPFIESALGGQIIDPCHRCSRFFKMPLLFEQAEIFGCEKVATGHYAKVTTEGWGVGLKKWQLRSPEDRSKDQSSLLHRLSQDELSRLIFPLSDTTKGIVRRQAMRAGLQRLALVDDGQGIPCFFEGKSACGWLDACDEFHPEGGEILDISTGKACGRHEGLHHFEVGDPIGGKHVVAKDLQSKELFVGSLNLSTCERIFVEDVCWTSIEPPDELRSCRVRWAYGQKLVPAHVMCSDDGVLVNFTKPVARLAPGLTIVFYSDDLVLGGGIVSDR